VNQSGLFAVVARPTASSGAKRLKRFVHAAQFRAGHARADAPGVDKSPRIVVKGEQQSADVRPAALGLAIAAQVGPEGGALTSNESCGGVNFGGRERVSAASDMESMREKRKPAPDHDESLCIIERLVSTTPPRRGDLARPLLRHNLLMQKQAQARCRTKFGSRRR
jgi:hypothetical protein